MKKFPNCIDCGKQLKDYRSKRCRSCSKIGNKSYLYNKKSCLSPVWKGGKPKCLDCGKEISYGAKRCHVCAYKHTSKSRTKKIKNHHIIGTYDNHLKILHQNMQKELHPNWRGGKSFEEYGAEFDSNLKEQIRFRDKYKCQLCGCSQIENGRQLDIHHIDYDKKNLNHNNLISLCRSCHIKTNYNRNQWIEKLKNLLKRTAREDNVK